MDQGVPLDAVEVADAKILAIKAELAELGPTDEDADMDKFLKDLSEAA